MAFHENRKAFGIGYTLKLVVRFRNNLLFLVKTYFYIGFFSKRFPPIFYLNHILGLCKIKITKGLPCRNNFFWCYMNSFRTHLWTSFT